MEDALDLSEGALETMPLDALVPYWRNPRLITDEAVNAVAESIRQFGYNQPIVVDQDRIIIVGHTRYAALRRLGRTEVEVRVVSNLTPQQVKQLRLVDNRTSELGLWDFEKLVEEMSGLDAGLMSKFFPEIAPGIYGADAVPGTTSWWTVEEAPRSEAQDDAVEFVCPACFHMWEQGVTKDQIEAGRIAPEGMED